MFGVKQCCLIRLCGRLREWQQSIANLCFTWWPTVRVGSQRDFLTLCKIWQIFWMDGFPPKMPTILDEPTTTRSADKSDIRTGANTPTTADVTIALICFAPGIELSEIAGTGFCCSASCTTGLPSKYQDPPVQGCVV